MVSHQTDNSAERWFKALPSRQFGPVEPTVWQQTVGSQIIEASITAREVIPQPKLQPNMSQGDQEMLAVRVTEPCRTQTFFYFVYLSYFFDFKRVDSE